MKEKIINDYKVREFKLTQPKSTEHIDGSDEVVKFDTIDQIIANEINNIESETFDKAVLLSILNEI